MGEARIESEMAIAPRPAARICDLVPGMRAAGVFVVKKLVRRTQPDGTPFTLFQFADRSGHINGVLWQPAVESLAAGDIAHVEGDVQVYQQTRQIRVGLIRRADPTAIDLGEFLPRSPSNGEAQWRAVQARIDAVQNPWLRQVYRALFGDAEFERRYRAAPAAKGWHHATVGGLLEHVTCMLELADVVARQHPGLDRDLVLGGCLLHDVGKLDELSLGGHIEYTDAGRLLGHLVQGCVRVAAAIDAIDGFPADLRTALLHLLVAHHGSVERGSPKPPMTLEAAVVHLLDHLDSQVHGIEQAIERGKGADGWTEPIKLLDRALFAGRKETGLP